MFQQASTEAANAFGNGDMYMEKFIERPRHIEFQVLADEHGNVMSLAGERGVLDSAATSEADRRGSEFDDFA